MLMTSQDFRRQFTVYFMMFGISIAFLSSLIGYRIHVCAAQEALHERAVQLWHTRRAVLRSSLQRVDGLVEAIAGNEALDRYLEKPSRDNKENLTNICYTIAFSDPWVMQVRFIDAAGMERIRVDRTQSSTLPFIVPRGALQDKSGRDYFRVVRALKRPVLWHSRLDLNVEHGKIEVPYRPTIRAAIPIVR